MAASKRKLQLRRGTNAERKTITPLVGELLWTNDTYKLWVGDGSTVGGVDVNGGTYKNLGSISGAVEIDFSVADFFYGEVVGATQFTFTLGGLKPMARAVTVKLKNAGSSVISLPAGTKLTNNTALALTTGLDTLVIEYDPVNLTYYAHLIGKGAV